MRLRLRSGALRGTALLIGLCGYGLSMAMKLAAGLVAPPTVWTAPTSVPSAMHSPAPASTPRCGQRERSTTPSTPTCAPEERPGPTTSPTPVDSSPPGCHGCPGHPPRRPRQRPAAAPPPASTRRRAPWYSPTQRGPGSPRPKKKSAECSPSAFSVPVRNTPAARPWRRRGGASACRSGHARRRDQPTRNRPSRGRRRRDGAHRRTSWSTTPLVVANRRADVAGRDSQHPTSGLFVASQSRLPQCLPLPSPSKYARKYDDGGSPLPLRGLAPRDPGAGWLGRGWVAVLTVAKLSLWSVSYYNDTARALGDAVADRQKANGGLAEYYAERDTRTPVWACAGDVKTVAEAVGLGASERAGGDADPDVVARWLDSGVAPNGECGRAHGKGGVHGFDGQVQGRGV